jgi:hypothetical protein
MNRIVRSWELFKTSLVVMMRHKVLLVFPILISALTFCMVVLFIMPVAFQPTGHSYFSGQHWTTVSQRMFNVQTHSESRADGSQNVTHSASFNGNLTVRPIWIGYFAIMYFATMFLATFLNVAFYHEIMNALTGQPVSIIEGLQFAMTRWKIIFMWALFAGIVGFAIKTAERRFGIFGQIIMKLLGAVWSVACVFVIPVIVMDEDTANPFIVLKRSAQTLVKTWGESLVGYAGVSMGSSIGFLFSLLWLGGGIATAVALKSLVLGAAAVASWLMILFVWSYLMGVAGQIFRCALYLYATQGAMPNPYTDEMAALAWKTKK